MDRDEEAGEDGTGGGVERGDEESIEEHLEGPETVGFDENTEPRVKVVRDPGCPTAEDLEKHNAIHMPYRPWCPICVEA